MSLLVREQEWLFLVLLLQNILGMETEKDKEEEEEARPLNVIGGGALDDP